MGRGRMWFRGWGLVGHHPTYQSPILLLSLFLSSSSSQESRPVKSTKPQSCFGAISRTSKPVIPVLHLTSIKSIDPFIPNYFCLSSNFTKDFKYRDPKSVTVVVSENRKTTDCFARWSRQCQRLDGDVWPLMDLLIRAKSSRIVFFKDLLSYVLIVIIMTVDPGDGRWRLATERTSF